MGACDTFPSTTGWLPTSCFLALSSGVFCLKRPPLGGCSIGSSSVLTSSCSSLELHIPTASWAGWSYLSYSFSGTREIHHQSFWISVLDLQCKMLSVRGTTPALTIYKNSKESLFPWPSYPPYGGLVSGSVCGPLFLVFRWNVAIKAVILTNKYVPVADEFRPCSCSCRLGPEQRCSSMEGDDMTHSGLAFHGTEAAQWVVSSASHLLMEELPHRLWARRESSSKSLPCKVSHRLRLALCTAL